MFDKKAQAEAEALVLDRSGPGNVVDRDRHGVDWEHRKYILEVRPPGGEPFRVETKAKVPIFSAPGDGDTVKVSYDPKNHKTQIEIGGDPRYDPALIRTAGKRKDAARREALLAGAPAPATAGVVHYTNVVDDEPQWVVPATCPECGARVDQSAQSMAEHPRCEYCSKPLPVEPAPHEQDY